VRLAAVLLMLAAAAACAGSSSGRAPAPKGTLIPWEAFYAPDLATIRVFPGSPTSAPTCSWHVSVLIETASVIKIGAAESGRQRGLCVAYPLQGRLIALRGPVGQRRIVAASADSRGTSYDLSSRLHPPFRRAADLPYAAVARASTAWTVVYPVSRRFYVRLVSRPADARLRLTGRTIRGRQLVTPCAAVYCWVEGRFEYALDSYAARPANTTTLLRTFADSLRTGTG